MTDQGPKRIGVSFDLKPHAYDPDISPEYFDGVLARRTVAFLVDLVILAIPMLFLSIFIFIAGIVTLGLGFLLYGLLPVVSVLWALVYYGWSFGRPESATIGMSMMDLEMRTWYGAPAYFVLGAVHAVVFWVTVSALTPLVLIVGLLSARRRLLHDILVGTIVINNASRARLLRPSRPAGSV